MIVRILVVSSILLAIVAVQEYSERRDALAELATVQARADASARAKVADTLDTQIGEVARTIDWLDEFYRSRDGLQRPEGLWDRGHLDSVGIATWVIDVYVANRLRGRSEAEARKMIEDAIRQSDEWRAKHPTAPASR